VSFAAMKIHLLGCALLAFASTVEAQNRIILRKLLRVAGEGDIYQVQNIIDDFGVSVNYKDPLYGVSVLESAIAGPNSCSPPMAQAKCQTEKWTASNDEVVKFLLNHKDIDVTQLDRAGYAPLHYAMQFGRMEAMKSLIENKEVDLNAKVISHGKNKKTAYRLAADNGHAEVAAEFKARAAVWSIDKKHYRHVDSPVRAKLDMESFENRARELEKEEVELPNSLKEEFDHLKTPASMNALPQEARLIAEGSEL